MIRLDHIAIWTDQRDDLLNLVADAAGLGIIDGYTPAGNLVARGVRFANGPFLDVHQVEKPSPDDGRPFHRLVGLNGDIDQVERRATASGLRAKAARRAEAAQPQLEAPWDLLSFRKGQGLASQMFVIAYHSGAPTLPDFESPLYDPAGPGAGSAELSRVWLPEADLEAAQAVLSALGAKTAGPVQSPLPPYEGMAFDLGPTQLVLASPWGPPSALRLDIQAGGEDPRTLSPLPEITFVLNGAA
ncbi:MAG: hypothetical protein Q7S93_06215 [Phenylobacterium sp.]|uniref:hypothetical protein n=1 Tax=Phenylobacterium sp. TaxID=1871053 RepID=UPI002728E5D9|nr:hypothetical protein [Phenylobacterium sp.]MDO8409638.1 hypothetical protein [Phenylobacterium sp.]